MRCVISGSGDLLTGDLDGSGWRLVWSGSAGHRTGRMYAAQESRHGFDLVVT